jgi:hypothetical protein
MSRTLAVNNFFGVEVEPEFLQLPEFEAGGLSIPE